MLLPVFTLLGAALLPAVAFMRREAPVALGAFLSVGIWEIRGAKTLIVSLIVTGTIAALAASSFSGGFMWSQIPASDPGEMLIIGLSTAGAVLVSLRISRYTSVLYALVGAVTGMGLAKAGGLDPAFILKTAAVWGAAPVVCALVAAGVYRLMPGTRSPGLFAAASLLLAVALGWNNGMAFGLFPLAYFHDWRIAGAVAVGIAAVALLFSFKPLLSRAWRIADVAADVHPRTIFAVIFASGMLLALSPVPLALSGLLMGGLIGAGAASGRPDVEGSVVVRSVAATAVAPVLGFLFCYSFSRSSAVLLVLIAFVTVVEIVARALRQRALQEGIVRSREQQIYSHQRSLSALEVRAEMTEKDLLNKLEIRRQELVDFAVGVSQQKEYMETIYEEISQLRQMNDPVEKDRKTDEILSSLRERMYFTQEMNDFYVRSELLHKDFNLKLREGFPSLTESERRLANLLRQGFSSKYIASLMNITPKSVEISRYRLRAKLGLSRSDNLIQFIKSI